MNYWLVDRKKAEAPKKGEEPAQAPLTDEEWSSIGRILKSKSKKNNICFCIRK